MNTKTMAIKVRLANHIRKSLYLKKRLEDFSESKKVEFFNEVHAMYLQMHQELNAYKRKRKDQAELLKKRQASPLTKSMKKKLGLIKKTSKKIYLENSK